MRKYKHAGTITVTAVYAVYYVSMVVSHYTRWEAFYLMMIASSLVLFGIALYLVVEVSSTRKLLNVNRVDLALYQQGLNQMGWRWSYSVDATGATFRTGEATIFLSLREDLRLRMPDGEEATPALLEAEAFRLAE